MFGRKLAALTARAWNTDARPLGMRMEQLIERAHLAAQGLAEVAAKLDGIDLAALETLARMFFEEDLHEAAGQVCSAASQLRNAARRARELEDAGQPITD